MRPVEEYEAYRFLASARRVIDIVDDTHDHALGQTPEPEKLDEQLMLDLFVMMRCFESLGCKGLLLIDHWQASGKPDPIQSESDNWVSASDFVYYEDEHSNEFYFDSPARIGAWHYRIACLSSAVIQDRPGKQSALSVCAVACGLAL